MINTSMREYGYYLLTRQDDYGQQRINSDVPVGTLKMSINTTSQSIQENINYSGSQYIGLTFAEVDDTYVIKYGEKRLKVLYVNPAGRYKQVFLADYAN